MIFGFRNLFNLFKYFTLGILGKTGQTEAKHWCTPSSASFGVRLSQNNSYISGFNQASHPSGHNKVAICSRSRWGRGKRNFIARKRLFFLGQTYSSVYAGQTVPGSSEVNNSLASHSSCDKNFQVMVKKSNYFFNVIIFQGTKVWTFKDRFREIHEAVRAAFDCYNPPLHWPRDSASKCAKKRRQANGSNDRIKPGHCGTASGISEF